MASIDRYRPPAREGYQPPTIVPPLTRQDVGRSRAADSDDSDEEGAYESPSPPRSPPRSPRLQQQPQHQPQQYQPQPQQQQHPLPQAVTNARRIPPAAPSPPTLSSRTSPPRPHSRRSAPSPTLPAMSNPGPSTAGAQQQQQQTDVRNSVEGEGADGAAARKQGGSVAGRAAGGSQWLFTDDEVVSTPSVLDGISPAEERLRRAKGVNFIYQAGVMLELPQITLWVAGVFFHRFYMRKSMVAEKGGVHHYNIAATALFLANKTEENCRKTKDIIIAVTKTAQKNSKLIIDEQSKEYWRWRDSILMNEELMLEMLTFDLVIDNPFEMLYDLLTRLNIVHNKRIRQAAWAFCNDACLTKIPLLLEAQEIAISAIFFSSTYAREPIDDVDGQPWWKHLDANEERLVKAIDVMRDFYTENPLRKQENPYQGSPEFSLENTRKRGANPSGALGGSFGQGDMVSSNTATPIDAADQTPPRSRGGGAPPPTGAAAAVSAVAVGPAAVAAAKDHDDSATNWSESQTVQGDSDVGLKMAANEMENHSQVPSSSLPSSSLPSWSQQQQQQLYPLPPFRDANGSGLVSPGTAAKRKSVEPSEDGDDRRPKKLRSEEGEA